MDIGFHHRPPAAKAGGGKLKLQSQSTPGLATSQRPSRDHQTGVRSPLSFLAAFAALAFARFAASLALAAADIFRLDVILDFAFAPILTEAFGSDTCFAARYAAQRRLSADCRPCLALINGSTKRGASR